MSENCLQQSFEGIGTVNQQDLDRSEKVIRQTNLYSLYQYSKYLYYLLYLPNTVVSRWVAKYDTSGLQQIFSLDTTRKMTTADIVVDSIGNFYAFTGNNSGDFDYNTDTILYISPNGQVLNKYPFVMNTQNAYGAFMFGNILYLGLGDGNPDYPDKLLPITIANDTAIAGQPIDMPTYIFLLDLSSCGVYKDYVPSSIEDNNILSGIKMYPNPTTDEVTIKWGSIETVILRIFDMSGRQVLSLDKVNSGQTITTSTMPDGLYLIQIISGNNITTQKLIVQH
jgi:hypothetical protein